MTEERAKASAEKIVRLAGMFSRYGEVTRWNNGEGEEAWRLAHSLVDLEESFREFLEDDLPKLEAGGLDESALQAVLVEIGEELRHILYHIRQPRYYRYLEDQTEDPTALS